ncbi:MAG: type II CAAX endopeptidase family protein [Phycisphaerae bacterium]|nr:type II CAAX endopeptidase family protein [Phycisphaerae bacterium]
MRSIVPPPVRAAIAWLVIIVSMSIWIAASAIGQSAMKAAAELEGQNVVSMQSELQGRLMHSITSFAKEHEGDGESKGGSSGLPAWAMKDAAPPPGASWIDRLAYALLLADAIDPDAGLAELQKNPAARVYIVNDATSDQNFVDDQGLYDAVHSRLIAWRDDAPRAPLDAAHAERLGWYAELLKGRAPPSSIAFILLGYGALFMLFGLAGVVLLVIGLVLALTGSLRSRMTMTPYSHIYAETFALWFVLFAGLNVLIGIVLPVLDAEKFVMLAAAIAMFGSLAVLAWPVVCGIPWKTVRQHVGLHAGKGIVQEMLLGVPTYACGLPLMFLGLCVFFVIRTLSPGAPPSHPITDQLVGGPLQLVVIFFLACVAAPIVEEVAFRGLLYRHLRDYGRVIGAVASGLLAIGVTSFLFAAIHPQGLAFVPVLGGLATAFCLAREWRDSLLASIVAHGLNNAVTLSLGILLLGGY